MRSLILIFVGHTCQKVRFRTLRLVYLLILPLPDINALKVIIRTTLIIISLQRLSCFTRSVADKQRMQYLPYGTYNIWTASSEKVLSSMRKICGFTSPCACAKYHPGIRSPFIRSIVSNDSVRGQRRPWSDCADAQADLGLRCTHICKDTFSHYAAHVITQLPLKASK